MKTNIKLSSKSYNGNSNVFISNSENGENISSLYITHSAYELEGFSKSEKQDFIKEQILSGLSHEDFSEYSYDMDNLEYVINSIMIYAHN